VVLQLHPFGQNSDRRLQLIGQSFDREQKLMLLRFDARFSCGVLAEAQKAPDLVAQLSHR
jgi:hypothetical protein